MLYAVLSMTVARHAIVAGHRIRDISTYISDVQIVVLMMNRKGVFVLCFAVLVVYSHVVTIFLPPAQRAEPERSAEYHSLGDSVSATDLL